MGQGRRMKKQGIPEPLDESLVTRKRKDAPVAADPERKKRSRTAAREAREAKAKATPKTRVAGKPVKPVKTAAAIVNAAKAKGKAAKAAPPPSDDEDDLSEDDSDLMDEDDINVTGLDALGSASEGEESIDEDEFDSDVVDSDTEIRKTAMWSDDEDDEDAEEKLTAANIAGLSRKLDEQKAIEEAEAQAELEENMMQTNIVGERPKILEDEEDEDGRPITNLVSQDIQLLRTRLTDTIRVLDDFKNLGEEGRSRAEYRASLLRDICAYYGYSEFLADKLLNLFPPREAQAFFEANETPRPVVIRTNTLRTHRRELAQSLINRGVQLEPVGKWSKVGLQIFDAQVPLGATPEYLAGHYILQAASSFLPVMALAPQENERVLDMAAAPGGKTTHLAALMKNTGCIFANDANKDRAKGLIGNIHRLGARNVIVSHYSALEFPRVMGGFDRVLLDAPCSGTGVIAKDASVKTNKTEADFMKLPHLQKQLLLAAIDSVNHHSKTGGYIVYSTCSVTVEENEQVVQYALNKRPNVKLVETGLTFGKEGFTRIGGKNFHPSMKMTRRYYPHTYNVDGFFVSKFKKIGPTPPDAIGANESSKTNGAGTTSTTAELEVIDRTPIGADSDEESDFGGFDEDEDKKYLERAQAKALRRKGKDPRAVVPKGDKATKEAPKVKNGHVSAKEQGGRKEKKGGGVEVASEVAPEKSSNKVSAKETKVESKKARRKSGEKKSKA
ncbi:NOL1/NOP2/sun family putative RNA met [Stemphylium lycopersici]|uniref:Nucleolar protein 2 n=1 Tax=Stemphylium lycopersici TaxID=183478 RepID=A0A364N3E5_STELY|nr:s-adenosylmethionine-dependent methyltransferase [Stemphylium lycopersici]RAR06657.1 NOL1/NOP2/sun family putative RNA met [Stemphylium lycopersici]RAR11038.1 NOL1/NOP2/sun family RNA met [Stemphylium lycopersici]